MVCCSWPQAASNLPSMLTLSETSECLPTISAASRPATVSVYLSHFSHPVFAFLFFPSSSQSPKYLSFHADHLVMASGNGSEPSIISSW